MMGMNEIWAWCPHCGDLTPAKTNWRSHLLCDTCNRDLGKAAEFSARNCPECGRKIYAPASRIDDLTCPCGASIAPTKALKNAEASEPELLCECGGIIECVNGVYRCPVCGKVFSDEEIHRKKYFATHKGSINIQWPNSDMAGRLIYVHPHSGSVGYQSVIIVDQYQCALYKAGGRYYTLENGTYSLFWDDRSEKDIRAALDYGRYEGERPIQLGTQVIFFDKRGIDQEYEATRGIEIRGTDYVYWPKFKYKLSIVDPETLMGNAFNYATDEDGWGLQSQIVKWVEETIYGVLSAKIRRMTRDDYALDPFEGISGLADRLDETLQCDDVGNEVNRKLQDNGRGVAIQITSIDMNHSIARRLEDPATCPHCHRDIAKQVGLYNCPHCGKQVWICPHCGKANKGSVTICAFDGRRGPY